ncbi:tRNA lysidine(34) synthetase TilS [Clostridiaceae bacterium 35-E11]
MLEKFLNTITRHKMITKGEGIVIGVSGGPDSISLLHLLWRIKDTYALNLYAVHLNHQFRGSEAQEDADYVKEVCKEWGIKSFIYSEDVKLYSKEKKITFEEAGREIRYHLFHEVMQQTGATKIAIAQNMDDQAETVFMRLIRGAGMEGLSAIDYVRDDKIIRPLLDISRQEIENYCKENNLHPKIDKTNLESVYTRNRIRLELIPYIEKYFNPNIKKTLCRTANLMREDKEVIDGMVNAVYHKVVKEIASGIKIDICLFKENHYAIQKRILRQAIKRLCGNIRNIENKHVENLISFIQDGQVGKKMDLPKGLVGVLDYQTCTIQEMKIPVQQHDFQYNIPIGEKLQIAALNTYLASNILDLKDVREIITTDDQKYFDLDKIKRGMILRNRRAGDRFTPLGMKGSKKLKDYFIDEKVPREKRDEIPLLCDGDEIMWVIGYRMSDQYKIDKHTKKILVVSYIDEKDTIQDK